MVIAQEFRHPIRDALLCSYVSKDAEKIEYHIFICKQFNITLFRPHFLVLLQLHFGKFNEQDHHHHQYTNNSKNPVNGNPGERIRNQITHQTNKRLRNIALRNIGYKIGVHLRTDERCKTEDQLCHNRVEGKMLFTAGNP